MALGTALSIALGAALACGPHADRPGATRADSEDRSGAGTLVVALSDDPQHLNPVITTQGGVHTASRLLYNGLVELGPDLEPLPDLAESWEVEEDGRLYRFRLRKDVVWHDGTPFTSADVKFTFEEVLLKYHSRARASLGTVLQSIDVPDERTVVFRFREPYAPFLQQLDVHEAAILPKHRFEGTDPLTNPANFSPIGTGPFRFERHVPDVEIRYAANERYHKPGLPRLGRIVMRVIPDRGSQVLALEAGEVDWLYGVPGHDRARLEREGFRFLRSGIGPGGSNCIMTLSFNLDRPMFGDVRFRRAVAHAIDREQFLERILFGQGRVADAPISSGIPFAHASGLPMPEHDPSRSRQLLEELGWRPAEAGGRVARGVEGVSDGTPLRFTFHHFPSFGSYGELLRAQLREVGIDLALRPLDPPIFVEDVFRDRAFDMNVISYCNSTDPEVGVRRMYVSSNIAPIPFSNASAYRNATVDSLFDTARRTMDAAARGEIYREIQEILVEELPYFWLVETESVRVYRPGCSGFTVYGHFAEAASCDP